MKSYLVTWQLNVLESNPLDAAKTAFDTMQRAGTTANVFTVREEKKHARSVRVDLQEELQFD